MKRINFLDFSKQKNVKDLVKHMETIEVEQHRCKIKKLLEQRKKKLKQFMTVKPIEQPDFNYISNNFGDFSFVQSNAAKEPFVSQKVKIRSFISERVYCSSPNMKVGNPIQILQNKEQINDKSFRNKKFLEYDQTIDQQSGLSKIQALQKKNQKKMYAYPIRKMKDMKKTFFQKIVIDKYHFYKENDYKSIRSSILSNSKTDKETKLRTNGIMRLKSLSTMDSAGKSRENRNLQNSRLNKSRLSKKITDLGIYRSRINTGSRMKSHGSEILMPISFQKNLDSIQN